MSAANEAEPRTDQMLELFASDPACAKCRGRQHRTETIRATGDGISRFVNLQRCRFNVRICERCGFTELYAIRSR